MSKYRLRALLIATALLAGSPALAGTAPVIDSFTSTPAVAAPGQSIVLRIQAHDTDCTAPPCTTGCGTLIRSDLLTWSDDTGRTPTPFSGSTPSATGSPWSATVNWIAPPVAGTYRVYANVADNGGMLCGGRQTKVATLSITVSSGQPPVIDAMTVSPASVAAGGNATVSVAARDSQSRPITYVFSADAGSIAHASPSASTATWTAPNAAGNVTIRCTATAGGVPVTAQVTAAVQIGAYLRSVPLPLQPTRMAALPDGRIAVVDGANGSLAAVTTSGQLSWRANGLQTPVAVAASGSEIIVLERGAKSISVWNTGGAQVRTLPLQASLPNGLAAGPHAGEIAVSDTEGARVLIVSSSDGRLLRSIGVNLLQSPSSIVTSGGRIAVADAAAGRVFVFDANGMLQTTLGDSTLFVRPQGLAWDSANSRFIVSDSFSGELSILGEDGALRGSLGGFGSGGGTLVHPLDTALLPGGLIAVATGGTELPLFQLLTTLPPLAPPSALTAADQPNDDGGAITLSWTRSPDDARVAAYRVERTTGESDDFRVVASLASQSTSWIDRTAADTQCYRYRIVATDGTSDAATAPSPCVAARNDLAPAAPQSVTAEATTPFAARIAWSAVAAPDLRGYAVEINGVARESSTTSLEVTGLQAETSYNVTVRAIDVAGNASPASMATVKTWPDEAPPAPAITVGNSGIGGTIDVAWTIATSRVPVSSYRIVATPDINGWPVIESTAASSPVRMTKLINRLPYTVTVTAATPWSRTTTSAGASVTPSAPALALPVVAEADEPAGIDMTFAMEAEKRELRLQYRAVATSVQVAIDGMPAGLTLADTNGVWTDATIAVDKKLLKTTDTHLLELRSSAFPDPRGELALRRVDFVPLAAKETRVETFNSVVDVIWRWQESRSDLGVKLLRDGSDVPCRTPALGRCRDTFRVNGEKAVWQLAIVSPAGWTSAVTEAQGHAQYTDEPPPVTDVVVTRAGEMFEINWTPVSSASSRTTPPSPVSGYRVYAAGALVAQVTAPPAIVPATIDAATLTVRSVDAQGKESP